MKRIKDQFIASFSRRMPFVIAQMQRHLIIHHRAISAVQNDSVNGYVSNSVENSGSEMIGEEYTVARSGVIAFSITSGLLIAGTTMMVAAGGNPGSSENTLLSSPGDTTYLVDPAKGDDTNPSGKTWKTYGKLNSLKLAPGDKVIIAPGLQEESLRGFK